MVNSKSLENLTQFTRESTAQWEHSGTTVIRVPKCLKRDILTYAHLLDQGRKTISLDLLESIRLILDEKIGKVKGYQRNNATKLIKDLRELVGGS